MVVDGVRLLLARCAADRWEQIQYRLRNDPRPEVQRGELVIPPVAPDPIESVSRYDARRNYENLVHIYFRSHLGWDVILSATEDLDEVSELDKFVVHGSTPVLSYRTRLDCVSAFAVNAAHLSVDAIDTHAVLEYVGTELRNGRKLEVSSDLLNGTGILDARC